jgi:hypothetical protein
VIRTGVAVLALTLALVSAGAQAQTTDGAADHAPPAGDPKPAWSVQASAASYFFPNQDNYVQPTVTADRGPLHLEARDNYEDRNSVSGFVGWNLQYGQAVTLQLTPMIGAVAGNTDGIVPALELDLAWRRIELYSEGEYVIDLDPQGSGYLYDWSELSVRATGWLRAGLATQRTRVYQTPRDIQRGPFVSLNIGRVHGSVYVFNPGADDHFVVASFSVTF